MKLNHQALMTLGAISLCVGCSGGSSSDDDQNIPPVGSLPITEANAAGTAGIVLDGFDIVSDSGDGAFDFSNGAFGAQIEADVRESVSTRAFNLAFKARDHFEAATLNGAATGVVITETQDCSVSGSKTFQIDTGSQSQEEYDAAVEAGSVPPQTSILMSFDNCVEEEEDLVNGSIEVTFVRFPLQTQAGEGDFILEIRADFDNLESDGERVNGDITALLTSTSTGESTVQVSGDRLEVVEEGELTALVAFSISIMDDGMETYEGSYDFTIEDDSLLGSVVVETLEAVLQNRFEEYPFDGIVKITGADNTSVTVTALDSVNAQLDIDVDGDGTIDVTLFPTWEELDEDD